MFNNKCLNFSWMWANTKHHERSLEDQWKAFIAFWINVFFILIFSFYQYMSFRLNFPSYLLLLPISHHVINLLLLRYTFIFPTLLYSTLISVMLGFSILIVKFGGYDSLTLYALPILPFIAGRLLGLKQGIVSTLIFSALVLLVCELEPFDGVHVFKYTSAKKELLLAIMIFLMPMLIATIFGWYEHIRIKQQRMMSEQNKKLEAVVRAKEGLVALLTHDISNHLSLISGSAELQSKMEFGPKQEKFLLRIKKGANNITSLVEMVREMQALEWGKMRLDLEPVNIQETVASSIECFEYKLKKKDLTISVNIAEDAKMVIAEPRALLNQVVNNILSNGIKFSHEGSQISISSSLKGGEIILAIKDSGIGMSEDLLEKIFCPSSLVSRAGTDGEKGTGFGLPLAKAYMEFFGGRISAESISAEESKSDHGTIFFLHFTPV